MSIIAYRVRCALEPPRLTLPCCRTVCQCEGATEALSNDTRLPQQTLQEPECYATLVSLFAVALEPQQVFTGVCEQRMLPAGSAEDCAPERLPAELQSHVGPQVFPLSRRMTLPTMLAT